MRAFAVPISRESLSRMGVAGAVGNQQAVVDELLASQDSLPQLLSCDTKVLGVVCDWFCTEEHFQISLTTILDSIWFQRARSGIQEAGIYVWMCFTSEQAMRVSTRVREKVASGDWVDTVLIAYALDVSAERANIFDVATFLDQAALLAKCNEPDPILVYSFESSPDQAQNSPA